MCRLLCRLISGHTGNSGEKWGSDRPSFRGVVVLENRARFLETSGFSAYFNEVVGQGAGIRTRDLLRPRQNYMMAGSRLTAVLLGLLSRPTADRGDFRPPVSTSVANGCKSDRRASYCRIASCCVCIVPAR